MHSFKVNFFISPVLCEHCSDYIWGSGYVGYTCECCSKSVHSQCKQFYLTSTQDGCVEHALEGSGRKYSLENYKIDAVWTVNEVKEWLAVVNLHRYSEVFAKSSVNGERLFKIDKKNLVDLRIHDVYHHEAILAAIAELQYRTKSTLESMKENEQVFHERRLNPLCSHSATDHYFLVATLTTAQDCNVCLRPLLGIIHQGLLCQMCGLLVHRQCSYLGLSACKQKVQCAKLIQYYVFGVSLFDLMNEYVEAPALLQKAFQDIEKRGMENHEDLYDAYRLSTDTRKLDKFKQQLNEHGVDLVQFCYYDVSTVATIVKAFLRELQDSVIPEEEYKTICRLATKHGNREEFCSYVNSLHPVHLKCLTYIMQHLIRVWKYQQEEKSCNYLPDKLIHIFRTILMRPPWTSVVDVVHNLEVQSLVLKRLLVEYNWGGMQLPTYKQRPDLPPAPNESASVLNSLVYRVSNYEHFDQHSINANPDRKWKYSLNDMPWYWSDITRDDTLMLLKDCKEGAFVVRDSSEKQLLINKHVELASLYPSPSVRRSDEARLPSPVTPNSAYASLYLSQKSIPSSVVSPYTLSILKGASIKSIKIFYDLKTKMYDIEVPCRFENVKLLIDYYTESSLKEYNVNLDLKLSEGLSKYKFGKTSEWNLNQLYSSFRDAYLQYENSIRKSEGIEVEIETLYQDLKNKHLANHAFENIVKLYEEQIDVLKQNLTKYQELAVNRQQEEVIVRNIEQLTGRINDLNVKKQELVVDCDYLNTIIQQLQDELEQLRPDLIELRKKRENYHMWLLQRGEDDEQIMKTLKSPSMPQQQQQPQVKQSVESSHENSINWYSADMSREDAEKTLKNEPNGTYLVRPSKHKFIRKSDEQEPAAVATTGHSTYALSLVHSKTIVHCLIDEDSEGCYIRLHTGNDAKKFSTLTNLIVYYSKNSLKNYNPNLDTLLLYPAFLNKNL